MKVGKLIASIIALAVMSLSVYTCDFGGGGGSLARTPEEEYARVYSLLGEGVTFNFDENPTFSASTVATLSGGNLSSAIEMSSVYTHDLRGENPMSYSYAKFLNSVSERDGVFTPFYDEFEYGFQEGASGKYAYLESMKLDDIWSKPGESWRDSYGDTINSELWTADGSTRSGTHLFSPDNLTNFVGDKSGGAFFVGAEVKSDKISEFADWIDSFFPLLSLKVRGTDEWRFFDLSDTSECRGRVEIKTSAQFVSEVAVSFTVPSNGHGGDMGKIEFAARMSFTSGGVTVKRLSYFGQTA